ncbi:putative baseplate assembly protein [Bradyrhizobium yuanmingense]|uniref:putative baseplate assembly protein n=1 Tax=Bradyrhizobium yuanmingense TaxID=108015 RepID=UPI0023B90B23|nr:putative baseplate assembly protein [Bradyrhizobium yuanmingense]MDF0515742.1 putative baseplate assembly protein [Bradyrhizobium yuanmingense]
MNESCDCCTTAAARVPMPTANRPGLSALNYRIGNYAIFVEAMKAELSQFDLPGLKTREPEDPAIALLDAWAMVADVLTFYQERIANEGFLRTAVERRSVLELATLVGATLRPGVSATVNVAYTLDQNSAATIPVGSRVQSLPVQDQLPQMFEVSDNLDARAAWNNLAPRLTRPQILDAKGGRTIYAAGLSTNLKPNDPLLVIAGDQMVRTVATIEPEPLQARTKIGLFSQEDEKPSNTDDAVPPASRITNFVALLEPLAKPPAALPAAPLDVDHRLPLAFAPGSGAVPLMLRLLRPEARTQFFDALRHATVAPPPGGSVHAFRVKAAPFGHNAPPKPVTDETGIVIGSEEWPLSDAVAIRIVISPKTRRRRDRGAVVDIEELFDDSRKSVLVQIARGPETANMSFELPSRDTKVQVGRWQVIATFDDRNRTLTLEFDEFAWFCKISHDAENAVLTVNTNGRTFEMPIGHTAETASGGERLRVSTMHALAIDREAAAEPTRRNVIDLDAAYDQIVRGSWIVIDFGEARHLPEPRRPVITQVDKVEKASVAKYGITGRVTRLHLKDDWLDKDALMLSAVRGVSVLAQSERLELAEAPIEEEISGDTIELAEFYGELPTGRRLIVEGERTDIEGTRGIKGAELVTVMGVELLPKDGDPASYPGERVHSRIKLASSLGYRYKRDTVVIHGNVASVTHGETKREVLGSGDASRATQQFTLRQGPVTHLPASTPSGTKSTLEVQVNGVPWTKVDSFVDAGPFDRCYITQTDEVDKTTVIFGDGVNGMRLPTGQENVTASYRVGLGSDGNVSTGAISQLATRPFGVKAVASPLSASGGVDRDIIDQGKSNIPRATVAMDRLVSVEDYAAFASLFGGVGKAAAIAVPGRRPFVYLTVAGPTWQDNKVSQHDNLRQALARAGDPSILFRIDTCELMLLIVAARVTVAPSRTWANVEPNIRAALIERFGYERRELGQSIALSEMTAAIQDVPGVAGVNVGMFDSMCGSDANLDSSLRQKLASLGTAPVASSIEVRSVRIDSETLQPLPAQLAFLSAELSDTLILSEAVQ